MNDEISEVDRLIKVFLSTLAIIITIGLIMVWSSSYILANESFGTPYHYIIRQLIYLFLAIGVAFAVSKTKYTFWLKFGYIINILAACVVALTIIKGIGASAKGASRWLSFGGMSLQPGEIVKFTVILSALTFFENWNKMDSKERMKHGGTLFLPLALLIKQPDFGTFFICFVVISFVCFMSSFPRKYFYYSLISGAIGGVFVLFSQAYRVKRMLTYLDPWKNPQGSGFQIIQSYMAFAKGSAFGQGLGNSNEKLFYLPEAHNDFIFSVIGEELGFIGVFLLICLFIAFIYFGFKLALQIRERKGLIMASAIVFVLGLQALLNMGVVLGLLPTKGLNLPFVSYGGSSLLCNFFGIGLLLSVIKGHRSELTGESTPRSTPRRNRSAPQVTEDDGNSEEAYA
ncbi:MAG: putative lipid II flippase FtsW [Bdellovibrionales bacterium]|nr:putative lipid II flippase FtsW [Bdellovibrionales bacterium]